MKKIIHKNINTKYILLVSSVFLFIFVFWWVNFLVKNNYLQKGTYLELFTGNSNDNSNVEQQNQSEYVTGHAVDMPYFADYKCKNWCGPLSQCLLTRTQCTSDVDCGGCQDIIKKNNTKSLDINDLGQNFMNNKFNPIPANEDILKNEYIVFSRFTKMN
jgi:hypothetical protein